MEVDHIIPKISRDESFKNKSIACRQCNISYKSKYNPALEIGYVIFPLLRTLKSRVFI